MRSLVAIGATAVALYQMVDSYLVELGDDPARPSPASASPSPAPPGSSAPRSSSGCCAPCPTASSCCSSAPAAARRSTQRVQREIFRNDAFDRLRDRACGKDALRRDGRPPGHGRSPATSAPTGSASTTPAAPRSPRCDIVIHSAATVAFDSPARRRRRGQPARPDPHRRRRCSDLGVDAPPRRGVDLLRRRQPPRRGARAAASRRARSSLDVDWRGEVDAARRARSRRRGREPHARAARRASATRPATSSAPPAPRCSPRRPSSCRTRWVERPAGRGRPRPGRRRSAGPTPTPTPRRSASGRSLETAATCPCQIVRPSIIESALAEPRPGWIRGFRMAEPVIISYARGLLKEFPGVPEGIVDVIPVDLVVGAIIAVAAAARPRATAPSTSSRSRPGSRQPAALPRAWSTSCSSWFTEHPLYDTDGQPIVVPEWTFPGRGRVQGQLERAKTLLERAEKVLHGAAAAGQAGRSVSATLEEQRERGRAGARATSSSTAPTPSARRSTASTACSPCWDALDRRRPGRRSASTPGSIDWDHYVHRDPPAVGRRARPGAHHAGRPHRRDPRRPPAPPGAVARAPPGRLRPREHAHRLERGRVVLLARHPPPARDDRLRFVAKTLAEAPSLLALDRKRPRRLPALLLPPLRGRAGRADRRGRRRDVQRRCILTKSFPAAIRRVREHRALGHRTVLITGALDFVVEPLRPLFDDIVVRLARRRPPTARYTGELADVPPTGEAGPRP